MLIEGCFCGHNRHKSFVCSMTRLFGSLMGPKYDGKYLRSLTSELLGDLTLKQTLTSVIIPSFDIKFLQPVIFSTYDVWSVLINFNLYIYLYTYSLQISSNYLNFLGHKIELVSNCYKFSCFVRPNWIIWKTLSFQMYASALLQHPLFSQHTTLRQRTPRERLEVSILLMVGLLQIIL